jgi:hypothetical protein
VQQGQQGLSPSTASRDLNWLHSGGGARAPGGARTHIGEGT